MAMRRGSDRHPGVPVSPHLSRHHRLAYARSFPRSAAGFLALARWGLAALLILPQSVLLGATFPLMAAGALRRIPAEPGRTLVLYFANSLGAAVGVLIGGFYLLGAAGCPVWSPRVGSEPHRGVRGGGAGGGGAERRLRRRGSRQRGGTARPPRPPCPPLPPLPSPALPSSLSLSPPRRPRSSTRSPGPGCSRWCSPAPRTPSS
jgi:hypothetical protein